MGEIIPLLLVLGGMVLVLRTALVGSRGRRKDGSRMPGAKSWRWVRRRYRPSTVIEATATGFAIGATASLLGARSWSVIVLGGFAGLAVGAAPKMATAVIGGVTLIIQVATLLRDSNDDAFRYVVISSLVVAALVAWVSGIFIPAARAIAQLPITMVLCVEVVTFAYGLIGAGDVSISMRMFLVLAFVVIPATSALAVAGGPIVPAAFSIALVVAELWAAITFGADLGVVFTLIVLVVHVGAAGVTGSASAPVERSAA